MSGFAIRPRRLTALAVVLILVVAFSLLPDHTVRAAKRDPRVLMLVLENIKLTDIDPRETPNIYHLLKAESAGLVSFRKAFNFANVPSAFYSTIGAGAPAAGLEQQNAVVLTSGQPLSATDPRLSARAKAIRKTNTDRKTHAAFGALGTALRRQGRKTAGVVSANSMVFLDAVMDENGRLGKLAMVGDQASGNGSHLVTDAAQFTETALRFYGNSDLTIASFADLRRLDLLKLRDSELDIRRAATVSRADRITGDLVKYVSNEDLLIVLMPFGGATDSYYAVTGNLITSGEPLSPIVIRGPGFRGILTSGTTRKTGVVGAADVAPTILEHLEIEPIDKLGGRIISSSKSDLAIPDLLLSIGDRALRHDALMLPVLVPVSLYAIAVLLVALISVWRRRRFNDLFLRTAIITLFLLPPVLSFPLVANIGPMWSGPATIAIMLAIALPLTSLPKNKIVPLLAASGLTPALFTVDIFFGSQIADLSLIGASLLTGGRYYGIGNPLFGMLFVFTVLFFVSVLLLWPTVRQGLIFKLGLALTFVLILVVVGSARFGANFGGLITLVIAWPYLFLLLIGRKPSGRMRILAGLSGALAVSLVVYDMALGPAGQSHIGRTFAQLGTDPIYIFDMIKTKVGYNLEVAYLFLFRWGGILIVGLLGALTFAVRAHLSAALEDFRLFKHILPGMLVGAVSAFFLNDTGFEPLMIIILYTLAAALYLYLSIEDMPEPDTGVSQHANNERMFA